MESQYIQYIRTNNPGIKEKEINKYREGASMDVSWGFCGARLQDLEAADSACRFNILSEVGCRISVEMLDYFCCWQFSGRPGKKAAAK